MAEVVTMRPEEYSPLAMYGNRDIFQKRLDEGYTTVALGGGGWVGMTRIVRMWAFFREPRLVFNNVATYQHWKQDTGSSTMSGPSVEEVFNTRWGFERFCKRNAVTLNAPRDLTLMLAHWQK